MKVSRVGISRSRAAMGALLVTLQRSGNTQ